MMRLTVKWCGILTGVALMLAGAVEAAEKEAFRVATFNIRCPGAKAPNDWSSRAGRVRALIKRHGFDLMGLQEATAGQMDDLLAPGWNSVGGGRDDGRRGGEASCIFYKTERFKVSASGTFWLSETPEVPGSKSWNTACTRICTWAKLMDRRSGKQFVYFNTHLDHMSAEARKNGMALILKRMVPLAEGMPTLLTGDMNATPGSKPIQLATAVLHDAGVVTRAAHTGPLATFNGFKFDRASTAQIDYIFVSPGIHVLSHATLDDSEKGLYPSDHFPVMADVVVE